MKIKLQLVKRPLHAISLLLGLVMIQGLVFSIISFNYAATGFPGFLSEIAQKNKAPYLIDKILLIISNHFDIAAPIIFILMSSLIILTFTCFRSWVSFTISGVFFFIWISFLHVPGVWLFQFLMIAFIALIIGLAYHTTPALQYSGMINSKKSWPDNIIKTTSIALFICFTLFILYYLSFDGVVKNNKNIITSNHVIKISTISALLSFILLSTSLLLDKFRHNKTSNDICNKVSANATQIKHTTINSTDMLLYFFGVMLVFQVIADFALGWFTTKGYENLIRQYAYYTNAPHTKYLLLNIGSYSYILHWVQCITESLIAICLLLRVFVLPAVWLATGLCGALSWVEQGIPATWPPHAGDPISWVWTLWFTTFCLLICAIYKTSLWLQHKDIKSFIFSYKAPGKLHILLRNNLIIINASLLVIATALRQITDTGGISVLQDTLVAVALLAIINLVLERYRQTLSSSD